jgi:hypothetical protein
VAQTFPVEIGASIMMMDTDDEFRLFVVTLAPLWFHPCWSWTEWKCSFFNAMSNRPENRGPPLMALPSIFTLLDWSMTAWMVGGTNSLEETHSLRVLCSLRFLRQSRSSYGAILASGFVTVELSQVYLTRLGFYQVVPYFPFSFHSGRQKASAVLVHCIRER